MHQSADKLEQMFSLREEFMDLLCQKVEGYYPERPINLSEKKSQAIVRDITLRGVEEMFESLAELKNEKPHRQTDVPAVDHDAFLEEFVDAFNYFFTTLKLVGIGPQELFDAYLKKHNKIVQRLVDGY